MWGFFIILYKEPFSRYIQCMSKSSIAKKKIKCHLSKYRHNANFSISNTLVQYWFHVLNKAAFRNKLNTPAFEVRKMKGYWGMCTEDADNTCIITISSDIDSKELFIATLAHEMVHQHQLLYENKISHHGSFLEWKRYFKRYFRITL